jgi:hypothetical protein
MSNAVYDKGREAFGNGGINWVSDTIKIVLLDATYTPNLATDQYYSQISSAVVGSPVTLGGKTNVGGVMDANDPVFSSVSGNQVVRSAIFKDTGTPTTSPLICLEDSATGLPITPNGGNINGTFDNGPNKIFKL